jgi:hypothetical protein
VTTLSQDTLQELLDKEAMREVPNEDPLCGQTIPGATVSQAP